MELKKKNEEKNPEQIAKKYEEKTSTISKCYEQSTWNKVIIYTNL